MSFKEKNPIENQNDSQNRQESEYNQRPTVLVEGYPGRLQTEFECNPTSSAREDVHRTTSQRMKNDSMQRAN